MGLVLEGEGPWAERPTEMVEHVGARPLDRLPGLERPNARRRLVVWVAVDEPAGMVEHSFHLETKR